MLIVCPACASEYEIPAEHVGASGRQVRCAACRETWFISAASALPTAIGADILPEDQAEAPLPAAIEGPIIEQPAPYDRPRETPPKSRLRARAKPKTRPRLAGLKASRPRTKLIAIGLACAALVLSALALRNMVVAAMPQAASLFASIGLPVNLRGIEIRDVAVFQNLPVGDKPGELVVEGDLLGIASGRVAVPDLAIEVRDEHDQTLYRWTVAGPRASLEAAENARFRASLSAPPAAGRSVSLRFVEAAADQERAAVEP